MKIFDTAILKLTGWYVLIIMVISIAFSFWMYSSTRREVRLGLQDQTTQLAKPLRVHVTSPEVSQTISDYLDESRRRLLTNLIALNVAVLVLGALASYFLAQRTLKPIKEATDAQNRFTADASHELRTPLSAMKTEIEVTLRGKAITKDEAINLLESNLEETDRMSGLAEGLLTLTQADAQLELKPTSLDEVAGKVAKRMQSLAADKHIKLERKLKPVTVDASEPALEKIAGVLLDNAIKYSPEKTTVTIKTYKKDGHGYMEVRDQGTGIKATELPHIFDRFYRADHSRSKQNVNGHGLGLSIAQQLAQQMYAKLTATSTPGKGSVFTLSFTAV